MDSKMKIGVDIGNAYTSTSLSGSLENKVTHAISQDIPANKEYLAERIVTLQKKHRNVIKRFLMPSGDKNLLKTAFNAEERMLRTVTNSDINLLNVHCDALLAISQNFHKTLSETLKGNFDLSKGKSLMNAKQKLLQMMDEKTAAFMEVYSSFQMKIEAAGEDQRLKGFLEKIQMNAMESFIQNQEFILNEFDRDF